MARKRTGKTVMVDRHVRLPRDADEWLRVTADRKGVTMVMVIEDAIRDAMERDTMLKLADHDGTVIGMAVAKAIAPTERRQQTIAIQVTALQEQLCAAMQEIFSTLGGEYDARQALDSSRQRAIDSLA